jgi:COP9 signalosome complex subunit 2
MSSSDYDYNDDQDSWSEEEEVDEAQVLIENTFYEAEDDQKKNPRRALEGFLKVLDLESAKAIDEQQYRFKALKNVIILECGFEDYEPMCQHLSKIIAMMDNVARNDATEAINQILDASSKITDQSYSMRVLTMMIDKLKESKNFRLLFNTNSRLAKYYLEKNELEKASATIQELIGYCLLPDGSEDPNKLGSLIEAYALDMQLCNLTKNSRRMKFLYKRTEVINADVSDPRVLGVIKECGSKMYMSEKAWGKALSQQFEAFKCYQEVGNNRAKYVLKHLAMTSILANSKINPFHSQEAKVYKDDPEIIAMMGLRTAYEANNMNEVQRIITDKTIRIADDPFIREYMDDLLRGVRLNVLKNKIKPYRNVAVKYLASELLVSELEVISLVVQLIMEDKIAAKIDQVEGLIEVERKDDKTKSESLKKWVESLHGVNSSLLDKIRV